MSPAGDRRRARPHRSKAADDRMSDSDAAIEERIFAPYELAEANIDVALLPYWYWEDARGRALIAKHLKADVHVACHVHVEARARTRSWLQSEFPEVVLFERPLETRRYERPARR